jgi:hypothetical protein
MATESVVVSKIAQVLEERFRAHIWMGDWDSRRAKSPSDERDAFLSRAVAALAIQSIAGCSLEVAGESVTDGDGDGGIDAFLYDSAHERLIFVSSKFVHDGNKGFELDAASELVRGIGQIVTDRFSDLNNRFQRRRGEILQALKSEADVRAVLVTATTSTQPLGEQQSRCLDTFIQHHYGELPELASRLHLGQKALYRALLPAEESVDLQVSLHNAAHVQSPLAAYFGRVRASHVAQWWHDHGDDLCTRNLRHLSIDSEVNSAMKRTISKRPEYFWYFNNGITMVCRDARRTLKDGDNLFINCSGVSIVNGVQTAGTIAAALQDKTPADAADPWVQVRIIQVDQQDDDLLRRLTEANNLQNRVETRDFAGLHQVQFRLGSDFALDGRRYVYKSNERPPNPSEGCDIEEATQALACARDDVKIAVQAKREIGKLWDLKKAFYKEIFPSNISSTQVWRSVLVLRAVDDVLRPQRSESDMVAIHLNRLILHLVFKCLRDRRIDVETEDEHWVKRNAAHYAVEVFRRVSYIIDTSYSDEYLQTFSKNGKKCAAVVKLFTVGQEKEPIPPIPVPREVALQEDREAEIGPLFRR